MADVTIPWSYIDNYTRTIHDLDEISQELLADCLYNTDLSNRDAVTALMRSLCGTSNEAAQELATQFYRGFSLMQTGKDMTRRVTSGYSAQDTDAAVAAIMESSGDDEELLGSELGTRLSYEINRASKRGVVRAGKADGRDVRYARVPVGVETCAWCIMLAGHGFFYMTEETASHSHANCDCAIVPSIESASLSLQGYDSTVYRDMWRNAAKVLRKGEAPAELLDRIERAKAHHESRTDKKWSNVNEELIAMRYFAGLKH